MEPARTLTITVSPGPEAPAVARRAVEAFLVTAPVVDDARLVTSELVTNAVLHGCTEPLVIHVRSFEDFARVEVISTSPPRPGRGTVAKRPRGGRDGGFGLAIVEALSDAWGIEQNGRVVVWSEFALRERASL